MTGSWDGAVTQHPAADRISGYVRDIAAQPDRPAAVARTVDLASKVLACTLVDLVQVDSSGTAGVIDSIDPARTARLIAMSPDGVCSPALWCRSTSGRAVLVQAVDDGRWPRYAREVLQANGLQGELNVGLEAGERYGTVLRFFTDRVGSWNEEQRQEAGVFAALAAVAIDRAALRSATDNLRRAVVSNRRIGTATGILMARRGLTDEAAFELLRCASQNGNRKLRDIADEVVLTGDLDRRLRIGQEQR